MSKLLDLITQNEELEPETLKAMFPNLNSLQRQKILALRLLKTTRAALEDLHVFENVVLTLNDLEPNINITQGCQPEHIWWFYKVLSKLFKNLPEFADEIDIYIIGIHRLAGYQFYPPQFTGSDNSKLEEIKNLANNGPFPLNDEDPLHIQAYRYLYVQEYLKEKEQNFKNLSNNVN